MYGITVYENTVSGIISLYLTARMLVYCELLSQKAILPPRVYIIFSTTILSTDHRRRIGDPIMRGLLLVFNLFWACSLSAVQAGICIFYGTCIKPLA